ncbi:hypothetical protein HZA44_02765 [Candidatus Peregrinibacteria bacterium]|nr:hypothetical protein [Candidatus Peregrinibacteria bacterium]
MKPENTSEKNLKVLVCEIDPPTQGREEWGTDVAEFRGKCYKLLGECTSGVSIPEFPLLATCVKKEEGPRPSIQILSIQELG